MQKFKAIALVIFYLASIVGATWAVNHFGVVPVGLGLMAPAGVYFIGLTLVLRDLLQRQLGARVALILIPVGALLSAVISPQLALASFLAFLVSESVDFGIFTATVGRLGTLGAIAASNLVSVVVDSIVFLAIAFGSLAFLPGQIWGKLVATALALAVIAIVRLVNREPIAA